MRNIQDAPIIQDTKVLVRIDLDVPIENGQIADTYRLDIAHETLQYLMQKKAKIIIMGHMGRPDGNFTEELSTKNLKPYFDNYFNGYEYELLENLRFDKGEEENSEVFSKELASKAEIYVNESFATSHRAHASMVGVPAIIPGYAGFRLQKEVEVLGNILRNPERPFLAIIGGAKIETKKPVIEKFLQIADAVLVGGKIGLDWSTDVPKNLFLPADYATDNKDIGEKTIQLFTEMIATAKTIVWAGPLGVFEDPNFSESTKRILHQINSISAFSVAGGGDTISAIDMFGSKSSFSFISAGGGAMLEFLVQGNLPAIDALM